MSNKPTNHDSEVKTELVPGEDYYIESGNWVFTAKFLKARGYCCDSGCRHCPYKDAEDVP